MLGKLGYWVKCVDGTGTVCVRVIFVGLIIIFE